MTDTHTIPASMVEAAARAHRKCQYCGSEIGAAVGEVLRCYGCGHIPVIAAAEDVTAVDTPAQEETAK